MAIIKLWQLAAGFKHSQVETFEIPTRVNDLHPQQFPCFDWLVQIEARKKLPKSCQIDVKIQSKTFSSGNGMVRSTVTCTLYYKKCGQLQILNYPTLLLFPIKVHCTSSCDDLDLHWNTKKLMLSSRNSYISSPKYGNVILARFLIAPVENMISDSCEGFFKNALQVNWNEYYNSISFCQHDSMLYFDIWHYCTCMVWLIPLIIQVNKLHHKVKHKVYSSQSKSVAALTCKLVVILLIVSSCYCFGARGIVSVVRSIVFSKSIKPFM